LSLFIYLFIYNYHKQSGLLHIFILLKSSYQSSHATFHHVTFIIKEHVYLSFNPYHQMKTYHTQKIKEVRKLHLHA